MDKLLALRMLLEVAETGGFSKAAQRLGIATSSVTRTMDALESSLGAALLTRTTRRVTLTDAGTTYVEQDYKILDDLAEADDSVFDIGGEPVGALRIAVPSTYSRLKLAPHLASFLREYPRIVLDIVVSDHYSDLAADRIDVAVRIGVPDRDESLITRKLADNARYVVASADYLKRKGIPTEPSALTDHECVRVPYCSGHRPARQRWIFVRDGIEEHVDIRGRLIANSLEILLEAVLADGGIALLPAWLVAPSIRDGHLQRLFTDREVNPHSGASVIYVAYLPNRRHSSKVHTFIDYIEARIQAPPEA
jgi:DNA-binding transcriptional LysR family regulator